MGQDSPTPPTSEVVEEAAEKVELQPVVRIRLTEEEKTALNGIHQRWTAARQLLEQAQGMVEQAQIALVRSEGAVIALRDIWSGTLADGLARRKIDPKRGKILTIDLETGEILFLPSQDGEK